MYAKSKVKDDTHLQKNIDITFSLHPNQDFTIPGSNKSSKELPPFS